MQRTSAPVFGAAVLLAVLAGFVDALAYTSIGGFFASFMTGNTTQLGIGIGTSTWTDTVTAGSIILSFLAGIVLASILTDYARKQHAAAVMLAVTILLAVGAVLATFGLYELAVLALAAGMGAENGVFSHDGEIRIGITYMTGTLVRFGERLAGALIGKDPRWGWVRDLVLWLAFLGGVTVGADAHQNDGNTSFWFAALGAGILTLVISAMSHRGLLKND